MTISLTHRWRPLSIQAYLFGALAILALSGLVTSLIAVDAQFTELQRATATRDRAIAYQTMMAVSSALGRERAFYVQLMNNGHVNGIHQARSDSDGALAASRRVLLGRGDEAGLAALDRIGGALPRLRLAADAELAQPDAGLRSAAGLALSRDFDALKEAATVIAADYEAWAGRDATPLQHVLIDLSRLSDAMRSLAGMRAALMVTLVGSEVPMPQRAIEALATLSGRIAGKWERIPSYVAAARELERDTSYLPPAILASVEGIDRIYMQDLARLYADLIEAGKRGGPYGLTSTEIYSRNTIGIGSIVALGNLAVMHLVASAEADRKIAYRRMLQALGLPAIILVVTGACVLLVRRRVLQPLVALTRTVHQLADGRRDVAIPELRQRDEMGKLAIAIETLRQSALRAAELEGSRQAVEAQLRQAQKMEAMGQLTGGLAHDFNNILGVVIGNLELLAEESLSRNGKEVAEAAMDAALRGAELTRQLLAFARRQPLAPARVELADVLGSTTRLLARVLGEHISLQLTIAAEVFPVEIDVSQLESAILNLAVNAKHAMPEGGSLSIEASNIRVGSGDGALGGELVPGDYVCIAVTDTGIGMPPEVLARAFEPFFTTKDAERGSGLGLSMVHGFVKQSGGHTHIRSAPARGTTVSLYLRRSSGVTVRQPDAPHLSAAGSARGQETILLVEDNSGMRDIALRQLKSLGYTTVSAGNAAEALAVLRADAPIDLLFTDVMMPGGMDGRELALAARAIRPEMKVLFTSGFAGAATAAAFDGDFTESLLSKPYRKRELARRIRAVLGPAQAGGRMRRALSSLT